MSHEIMFTKDAFGNDIAAAAWTGDTPWHGLGHKMPRGESVVTAAAAANLLWEVQKQRLYVKDASVANWFSGQYPPLIAVDEAFAIVAPSIGRVLGVVRSGYEPVQNRELFEIADTVQAEFSMLAGLSEGRRIFVCLRLPEHSEFALSDGDQIKSWVLLTWGHDGRTPIRFGVVPLRVVCQNTLTAALGDFTGFVIKHLPNAELRVALVADLLNKAIQWNKQFKVFAEECKRVKIEMKEALAYFKSVLGLDVLEAKNVDAEALPSAAKSSRTLQTLEELFAGRQQGAEKTLWGALNAVSYYTDHEMRTRNGKLDSLLFGRGGQLKTAALVQAKKIIAKSA